VKIEFRDEPIKEAVVKFDFWDKILLSIPRLRDWYARHLGRKIEEEVKLTIPEEDYVKIQLKTIKDLVQKARWAKSRSEQIRLLVTIHAIIHDLLEAMGVKLSKQREAEER